MELRDRIANLIVDHFGEDPTSALVCADSVIAELQLEPETLDVDTGCPDCKVIPLVRYVTEWGEGHE